MFTTKTNSKILIIAPHPDDEVLGCGGVMARFSREGHDVFVIIVTKAGPPLFSDVDVDVGRKNALKAHALLGVKKTFFCDLPAVELNHYPHYKINAAIGKIINELSPNMVFIPFWGDMHLDHQVVALSSMVAVRPNRPHYPEKILAYETVSETNWNAMQATGGFQPNFFVDISQYLELKLQAFALNATQVKDFPNERSLKTLEALAHVRGSAVHREAAEAFMVIREVF